MAPDNRWPFPITGRARGVLEPACTVSDINKHSQLSIRPGLHQRGAARPASQECAHDLSSPRHITKHNHNPWCDVMNASHLPHSLSMAKPHYKWSFSSTGKLPRDGQDEVLLANLPNLILRHFTKWLKNPSLERMLNTMSQ